MSFDRRKLQEAAGRLAAAGVFLGTSSWKYPGWQGQLYDQARYVFRGRYSKARFERNCLAEYAEVFKTVSVDAAYYQFPTAESVEQLMRQVPGDFLFTFKVTDELTLRRFPNLPRFGRRAGQNNPHFLNAELFQSAFLGPCLPHRANAGMLLFEFARFRKEDFERGRDFVAALDAFLAKLPAGWRYGVEVRNPAFLQPDYFAMLASHGVAHVFNSWEGMPSVAEQMDLEGSFTSPGFCGARFLLRPGRRYEEAVKLFSPYDRIQDIYPEGRAAGARLLRMALGKNIKAFVYLNNRFEGNALETLLAMIAEAAL
jgi:uncharacterized protein YecE (DUF72 family)